MLRQGGVPMKGPATGLLIGSLALATMQSSRAADLLGLYAGGSVGQSQVKAAWTIPPLPITTLQPAYYSGVFNETATAFKILAGIRPLSFIGAEIAYDDLGHAQGNWRAHSYFNGSLTLAAVVPASVTLRGGSAFGVVYFPLPIIDFFAKAGVATLRSSVTHNTFAQGDCGLCLVNGPPADLVRTNSNFAAGAGAQLKFGSWGVRAEYEYFTAAGAHPTLLSLGATWSFR